MYSKTVHNESESKKEQPKEAPPKKNYWIAFLETLSLFKFNWVFPPFS